MVFRIAFRTVFRIALPMVFRLVFRLAFQMVFRLVFRLALRMVFRTVFRIVIGNGQERARHGRAREYESIWPRWTTMVCTAKVRSPLGPPLSPSLQYAMMTKLADEGYLLARAGSDCRCQRRGRRPING